MMLEAVNVLVHARQRYMFVYKPFNYFSFIKFFNMSGYTPYIFVLEMFDSFQ